MYSNIGIYPIKNWVSFVNLSLIIPLLFWFGNCFWWWRQEHRWTIGKIIIIPLLIPFLFVLYIKWVHGSNYNIVNIGYPQDLETQIGRLKPTFKCKSAKSGNCAKYSKYGCATCKAENVELGKTSMQTNCLSCKKGYIFTKYFTNCTGICTKESLINKNISASWNAKKAAAAQKILIEDYNEILSKFHLITYFLLLLGILTTAKFINYKAFNDHIIRRFIFIVFLTNIIALCFSNFYNANYWSMFVLMPLSVIHSICLSSFMIIILGYMKYNII